MTSPPVLAADIGGTQMRAALVDPGGVVLLRRSVPTPKEADVPASLIQLIRSVAAEHRHGEASRAVVGLPGVRGRAAPLGAAPPRAVARPPVERGTDRPPRPARQPRQRRGSGGRRRGFVRRRRPQPCRRLSDGLDRHRGRCGPRGTGPTRHRSLAEVGHTVIDWRAWREGAPCTLEELSSGSGVVRLAHEAGLGALGAREIQAAAAEGEPRAAAIWQDAITACAAGVSNLVMSFSTSTVIIGGGLGRQQEFFSLLRELVLGKPGRHPEDLTIVRSALGDDAGLSGAAGWKAAIGLA